MCVNVTRNKLTDISPNLKKIVRKKTPLVQLPSFIYTLYGLSLVRFHFKLFSKLGTGWKGDGKKTNRYRESMEKRKFVEIEYAGLFFYLEIKMEKKSRNWCVHVSSTTKKCLLLSVSIFSAIRVWASFQSQPILLRIYRCVEWRSHQNEYH